MFLVFFLYILYIIDGDCFTKKNVKNTVKPAIHHTPYLFLFGVLFVPLIVSSFNSQPAKEETASVPETEPNPDSITELEKDLEAAEGPGNENEQRRNLGRGWGAFGFGFGGSKSGGMSMRRV